MIYDLIFVLEFKKISKMPHDIKKIILEKQITEIILYLHEVSYIKKEFSFLIQNVKK